MARSSTTSGGSPSASSARPRAHSDILIVDHVGHRGEELRRALRDDGYHEPELAASGDEALDILGAHAQRFDLLIAWVPLADSQKVDLFKVLRQLGSPVRIACATDVASSAYPRPGQLAGATAVLYQPDPRTMAVQADILIQNGERVRDIVNTREVPRLLPDAWALAIYGTRPGGHFTAPLD